MLHFKVSGMVKFSPEHTTDFKINIFLAIMNRVAKSKFTAL
jgi:hypothetical protein